MSKQTFYIVALMTAVFSAVLWLFPQIDLIVSGWFYKPGQGFLFANNEIFTNIFRNILIYTTYIFIILLGVMMVFGILFKKLTLPLSPKICFFLLICFAAGPALAVNEVLKNHWGRARPYQVEEFDGYKTFTTAWVMSRECERNCSFTSGETANVFCYLALIFIVRRKKLITGIVLTIGALTALERIAQGDHFFSDTILSGFIDYLLIWLIYQLVFAKEYYFGRNKQWQALLKN
jgi:lipid A 4'-phosphatase